MGVSVLDIVRDYTPNQYTDVNYILVAIRVDLTIIANYGRFDTIQGVNEDRALAVLVRSDRRGRRIEAAQAKHDGSIEERPELH